MGLSLKAEKEEKKTKVLAVADKLFNEGKYSELLNHLMEQESWYDDADLLWRVARSKFHISKQEKETSKSAEMLRDSLVNVERALELDPDCGPAHKWAAILIDTVAASKGTRSRIEETMNVKHHMEHAIRLMPNDGTSHYLLGEWHYSLATTGWASRQIASLIFAQLPEASLEEALQCFETAERVEPGFYSKNLVLKAKTLIALGRGTHEAKESLLKVVKQYSDSNKWDDKEAVSEARSLLKQLGVRV